jgi:hypothetical protein
MALDERATCPRAIFSAGEIGSGRDARLPSRKGIMKVSVVHPHRTTREVLAKALAVKLDAEVVSFSCLENLFEFVP